MRRKREGWLGFFAFLFLWVKGCCCSRAPQKKRQASQEAKAACLFISLSRFCWRNETKAKRKKREGQLDCWIVVGYGPPAAIMLRNNEDKLLLPQLICEWMNESKGKATLFLEMNLWMKRKECRNLPLLEWVNAAPSEARQAKGANNSTTIKRGWPAEPSVWLVVGLLPRRERATNEFMKFVGYGWGPALWRERTPFHSSPIHCSIPSLLSSSSL